MKRISTLLLATLLFVAAAAGQKPKLSPDLASLVAAERAFARTSVKKGIRESFLAFFANEGINFQPHPVKTREAILKRPAPARRPPVTLNWEPVYADVSQAGDLGYTTGPYVLTDQSPQKNPPHYGFYFSVWKKQKDGTWKVVIDAGIDTPDHSQRKFGLEMAPGPRQTLGIAVDPNYDEADHLMNLDKKFLQAANSGGLIPAFLDFLGDDRRLHRNGNLPLTDSDAIRSFLLLNPVEMSWQPMYADVARSRDLGYTYGSYELKYPRTNEVEKGYYVRVWKRNGNGVWKIALDTLTTIPAETN
ncbi:MAG: nuclear transport factor 2 family protein [Pyrinomonadaceae bacterium]